MWDVWFLGQIVYSSIEHPSIINKIQLLIRLNASLSLIFPQRVTAILGFYDLNFHSLILALDSRSLVFGITPTSNSTPALVLSKVIIHKLRGEQFLWNPNWHLGWFWAGWQYWNKKLGQIWETFKGFFSCFYRQKNV